MNRGKRPSAPGSAGDRRVGGERDTCRGGVDNGGPLEAYPVRHPQSAERKDWEADGERLMPQKKGCGTVLTFTKTMARASRFLNAREFDEDLLLRSEARPMQAKAAGDQKKWN